MTQIETRIRLYYAPRRALPQSTSLFPTTSACASPGGKIPALAESAWAADPGWRDLGFHINEDSYFQYQWTLLSSTSGVAVAIGDLDCDDTYAQMTLLINLVEDNVFETTTVFLDD